MSGECILIVDDEANIIELARLYLVREGFRVVSTGDGSQALAEVTRHQPALLILDIMLPGVDGFEITRQLRFEHNPIPILMLTARDEDIDKIIGLELGADDYLTKPFNPRELVARVKAILRRTEQNEKFPDTALRLGDLVIDPARREVWIGGTSIDLRFQEFNLLLVLMEHKSLVLSREQILNLAWGFDYLGQTRTVDVHISSLRKKLQGSTVQIETVTGSGYKLVG